MFESLNTPTLEPDDGTKHQTMQWVLPISICLPRVRVVLLLQVQTEYRQDIQHGMHIQVSM